MGKVFSRPECVFAFCPTVHGCVDACRHPAGPGDTPDDKPVGAAPIDDGWMWAIVEVFGHRSHAGRVREEERFGAKLLRIEVPSVVLAEDGAPIVQGWNTIYYGGASIFSVRPCLEADVLAKNAPYRAPAYQRLFDAGIGDEAS